MDWHAFWQEYPKRTDDDGNLLKQVGKTIGGVPITDTQLATICASIIQQLEICNDDYILDICCGNGLLTRVIADKCKGALGIDFSRALIEVAQRESESETIRYKELDARKLEQLIATHAGAFSKVLCYEALAFLTPEDLDRLLKAIRGLMVPGAIVLLGSVLDRSRRWNFFNTWKRKWFYWVQIVLLKREVGLGRWWRVSELERIAQRNGFKAAVVYQDPTLHTSHYRFDIKLMRLESPDV